MERSQSQVVTEQFDAQAHAYLVSPVHAAGEDLRALAQLAAELRPARALDLGCGGGHASYAVAAVAGHVVAYDLSPSMLDTVARSAAERGLNNIQTQPGQAERLPFESASFDLVVTRFSAHHWHDLDSALREAARVLRPGGRMLVVDTISPGRPLLDTFLQTLEVLRDPSHVRNYTRAEWDAAGLRAGLLPGRAQAFRLRLDFAAWVERIRTPPLMVQAVRALQAAVADDARRHFAVEPDGSFTIDVALMEFALV